MRTFVTVEIDIDTTDRDISDMWSEIAEAVSAEFNNADSNIYVEPVNPYQVIPSKFKGRPDPI